jgi:mycofactocin precursor
MPQQARTEAIPAQPEPAGAEAVDVAGDEAVIAEELLVEEISIDGMCGVY